jgi:signal transduction histidine kinase/integral membrane sensor domain MASE1
MLRGSHPAEDRVKSQRRELGTLPFGKYIRNVLFTALAYVLIGKFSIWLAIPPSYEAPIFPPAGIALAGVLLLGYPVGIAIGLASFCLNLWNPLLPSDGHWLTTILLSLGLGIGPCLQALLGTFLIRRFVSFPTALVRPNEIAKFLILGGPIASLLGATSSVVVLSVAGILSQQTYLSAWWSEWMGDTNGVLVFTPLLLIFLSEPREVWARRRLSVALPLCLIFLLNIAILFYVGAREQRHRELRFERDASTVAERVQRSIDGYLDSLYGVESALMNMEADDRERFALATQRWFSLYPGIHDFTWIPWVPSSQRTDFESHARKIGLPSYEIRERRWDGKIGRSPERADYFPVLMVYPTRDTDVVGYDQGSSPGRRQAMDRAKDSGKPAVAGPLRMMQNQRSLGDLAIMVYLAIYHGSPVSLISRRKNLRGFLKAVFRLEEVIESSISGGEVETLSVALYDEPAPSGGASLTPLAVHRDLASLDDGSENPGELSWKKTIDLADRKFLLHVAPTEVYMSRQRDFAPQVVLVSVLVMSGLSVALLLTFTGHSFAIEQELGERRRISDQLSRTNAELEQFGYIASHDLQEPLRMVSSYLQLIQRRLGETMEKEISDYMGYAIEGARRMRALIHDLLAYSKVGRTEEEIQHIDVKEILDDAVQNLQLAIAESGAEIIRGPMPTLHIVRTEWLQLIQNLVGNAIKYREEKRPLKIEIVARREEKNWIFSVRDNGIGISSEYFRRIFLVFQRLHDRGHYSGTGVGLAICKKIVEGHGGRIWLESTMGEGTTFFFSVPSSEG